MSSNLLDLRIFWGFGILRIRGILCGGMDIDQYMKISDSRRTNPLAQPVICIIFWEPRVFVYLYCMVYYAVLV